MSQQQAQIEALEHLVVALVKELGIRNGLPLSSVIGKAKTSLFDSDGPGGPQQKEQAVNYLESLAFRMGQAGI